jgi:uncharacterized protein (DUF1684 family)
MSIRKMMSILAFLLAVGITTALVGGLSQAARASGDGSPRYVDGSIGNDSGNCSSSSSPCKTLSYAVSKAASGDTIYLANTITETGQLVINKTLTIQQWPDKEEARLLKNDHTGDYGAARCWICLTNNAQVTIEGIAFSAASGKKVMEAIRVNAGTTLTLSNTVFENFFYTDLYGDTLGIRRGYAMYVAGGALTVEGSEFKQFGRSAILACGGQVSVQGSKFVGDGNAADGLVNYGIVGGNDASLNIGSSQFSEMKGNYYFIPSAALWVLKGQYFCSSATLTSTAVVTSTHFLTSERGILVGEGVGDNSSVEAHGNRFFQNNIGVQSFVSSAQNLEYNWWGCKEGPSNSKCDGVAGDVDFDPWLTLTLNLQPQSAYVGDELEATAEVKSSSYFIPDGVEVTFSGQEVSFSSSITTTLQGEAVATGTVGGSAAQASRVITATLDHGVATGVLTVKKRTLYLPLVLREYSIWEQILKDDFNFPSTPDRWEDDFGGTNFYHSYAEGQLRMTANESNKSFLTLLKDNNTITDNTKRYAIEVKSVPVQNPYRFGLVLGYRKDSTGRYFFSFRIQPQTQGCELRIYEGSAYTATYPCAGPQSAIIPNGVNVLRAEFGAGDRIDFYVNGGLVFTYNLPSPVNFVGTKVGMITVAGSQLPSVVAFDDFVIYRHR